MFCCEFCEISENTFFTEHRWTTASKLSEYNNVNGKTEVTSYYIRVESFKAGVEIERCKFKFASYDIKSMSSNSRVTSSNPRVQESFNK